MTVLIEKTKIKSIASRVRSSQILGDWIPDYDDATQGVYLYRPSGMAHGSSTDSATVA